MPTSYTKLTKPIGTNYTAISSAGSTYDDAFDIYDSATDSYDGSAVLYTPLTKPTGTNYIKLNKPT